MFFKGACYRDVVRGDFVSENADHPWGWYEVARVELVDEGRQVRLDIVGGGALLGASGTIIGLFRRPWERDRMSESNPIAFAQAKVLHKMAVQGFHLQTHMWGEDLDKHLTAVRLAIEEYELGRQEPDSRRPPEEPVPTT